MAHDWQTIEIEYIQGNTSQRDLAQKYEVSISQIGEYAARNDWFEKREHFRSEVSARTLDAAADRIAAQRVSALELCDAIIETYMKQIADVGTRAKVTAFDAVNAARFREALTGGVESRTETVVRDWREVARKNGIAPAQLLAEFQKVAAEEFARSEGKPDEGKS